MDWNRIKGNWKMFRGKIKERWGKLTDDDLDVIAAKRDQLVGRVQKTYGIAREDAERDVAAFEREVDASAGPREQATPRSRDVR